MTGDQLGQEHVTGLAEGFVASPQIELLVRHRLQHTVHSPNQSRRGKNKKNRRFGFSLLELLAVVTILGIIAVVVIPRISVSSGEAKKNADQQNRSEINSAVERWYFNTGTWPKADLTDIGADANYFPAGLPTNPIDGSAYALDATTHRVK